MHSNWSYSLETPNLGQIWQFLASCDLEIWCMTLKNNRAPFLCCLKLCAWFHCHMQIQTGVRVPKELSWVLTSVTLTFDLWPWPFALTSLLIRWREHSQKAVTDRLTDGQTDRQTDRQTDWTIHKAAWSQLKMWDKTFPIWKINFKQLFIMTFTCLLLYISKPPALWCGRN